MIITKLEPEKFDSFYNILCRRVFPSQRMPNTPFSCYWVIVEPGTASKPHRHHEGETFILAQGSGQMICGDETAEVSAGDVVEIPPFTTHSLRNTGEENILFLDLYWEDMALALGGGEVAADEKAGSEEATDAATDQVTDQETDAATDQATDDGAEEARPRRLLAVSAPSELPLPAAPLERAAPLLAADLLCRFHRMRGGEAHHRLGTAGGDAGTASGRTLAALSMTPDSVSNESANAERGRRLVAALQAAGRLVTEQEGAEPPRLRFPLEPYREALGDYYEAAALSTAQRGRCYPVLDGELPAPPVARPGSTGSEVESTGFDGQRLAGWVERLSDLLAAPAAAGWGDEEHDAIELVPVCDAGSAREHGVLLPALLLALDDGRRPPRQLVLWGGDPTADSPEGSPLAGDAGAGIDLENALVAAREEAARFATDPAADDGALAKDALRLCLADLDPVRPAAVDRGRIAAAVRELAGWQRRCAAACDRVAAAYDGTVQEPGMWTDDHLRFLRRLKELVTRAAEAASADACSPRRLAQAARELVAATDELVRQESAWGDSATAADERRTGIALELAALRTLARVAAPLLPATAARIWHALGHREQAVDGGWEEVPHFVTAGNRVDAAGLVGQRPAERPVEEPVGV